MRSKQASIYFIQSSQSAVSRLIAENSIILFSQCEALYSVLFLYYSILSCCTFHPIFISGLRWCLCSFCTVYPLFIMTLCFVLSTGFVRTHLYFVGFRISRIPVISVGFCQIISLHILSRLWIESHYQSMAYLVEKGCSTQKEPCIEELHEWHSTGRGGIIERDNNNVSLYIFMKTSTAESETKKLYWINSLFWITTLLPSWADISWK